MPLNTLARVVAAAALTLTLGVGAARADEAPPDDYVETCTIEQQRQAGETCVTCQDVRPRPEAERCEAQMSPQGYAFRCSAWGATVATTVWCKADPNAAPVTPVTQPTKPSSCAAATPAGLAALAMALGVGIALALGRARRQD